MSHLAIVLNCLLLLAADSPELKVVAERDVAVPMRDGVVLRANVFRPDHGGPYPVLVMRTPYGKPSRGLDRYVMAGYIVVTQDARGRYASDGKWESFVRFETHDAEDGYDTVEWAAKLPGSTGKAGTFGASYNAFLQWRLAPLRPPSLVATAAFSIPARYTDLEGPGTIRPGRRLNWWVTNMAPDMRRKMDRPGTHTNGEVRKLWNAGDSNKWLYFLPWLDLPREAFEDETEAVQYWLEHPYTDPWKLQEGVPEIAVPNLDVIGWYDHCNGDMMLDRAMMSLAKTEIARKGSRTIIGPWAHVGRGNRRYGNIDFGPNAQMDVVALEIQWFDYWLKGERNGIDKTAPYRIFVTGDNQWRDEQVWPLARAKEKVFYLTSGGHANTPVGDGKLVIDKSEAAGEDRYTYDPTDPVPSLHGPALFQIPTDQRPLADRQDILVYQTGPLDERIEVTGNPVVELYAASSAPDTDFFVRLIDVAPDGMERDVSMGMVRARYRHGLDKPKLITPDEVVKYTIRMNATSNAFLPGHRLRLDVTSSDFPNYDRNHNTAADQNADATLKTAQQTIYHGGECATRIVLPWIATAEAQPAAPDILLRFFGPDGIQDKRAAYHGEMLERYTERPTLGEGLPKNAECEFRKLDETENSAVYAVLVRNGQKTRDYYAFLASENGVWKISAVRGFAIPGMYTRLIQLLGLSTARTEEEEWRYRNGLLVTKNDRELKIHLKEQTDEFNRIVTLMAGGDEAQAQTLAKSLFLNSVENRDGVIDFNLGGMLDNSVGYLYVPPGKKPPSMDPGEFIYVEQIAGGWYIYRTT